MRKIGILAVIIIIAVGLMLFPHIWNSTENGPDLRHPSIFLGCYESGSNRLVLSRRTIAVTKTHQSTQVVRFFYLKNDAAINTVNNLQYDASGSALEIGSADTGFFYKFDNPSKPSALFIPDDGGTVRKLLRVPC
jgi:hypothetical protein